MGRPHGCPSRLDGVRGSQRGLVVHYVGYCAVGPNKQPKARTYRASGDVFHYFGMSHPLYMRPLYVNKHRLLCPRSSVPNVDDFRPSPPDAPWTDYRHEYCRDVQHVVLGLCSINPSDDVSPGPPADVKILPHIPEQNGPQPRDSV